jgi:hypothetical protein
MQDDSKRERDAARVKKLMPLVLAMSAIMLAAISFLILFTV